MAARFPRRLQHRIYWSHRRTDDLVPGPGVQLGAASASEHVAFQRMAHHAGLAYLDEVRCWLFDWLLVCCVFDARAYQAAGRVAIGLLHSAPALSTPAALATVC